MGLTAGIIGMVTVDRDDNWKIGGIEFITPTTAIGAYALLIGLLTSITGIWGWFATNSMWRKLFW